MSDNALFDIQSEGRETFNKAFELVWKIAGNRTATYYFMHKSSMVLCWCETDMKIGVRLPYPMNMEAARDFMWHWLSNAPYPVDPDIDGDVSKGWRIYNEDWGHVADHWQAFLAVEPVHMLHGR